MRTASIITLLMLCMGIQTLFSRTLTIHSTSWKLKDHLAGINPQEYQELRIVGSINYDDMKLIADYFRHIRVLDLSKATVDLGNRITTGRYDVDTRKSVFQRDTIPYYPAHTIPDGAVFGGMNVEEFMFPRDIVAIQSSMGFKSLRKLPKFPATLKALSSYAFEGNLGMQGNLILPKEVEVIGYGAFSNCPLLRGTVKVPVSLDMYKSSGFLNGCTGLEGVRLPKGYPCVVESGFIMSQDRKRLLSGAIPARRIVHLPAVEEIYESACGGDKEVREVVCAQGLKKIGEFAFSGCLFLNKITLPEGLEVIGRSAFYDCHIDEIIIPSTVRKIGASRWTGTKRLIVKSPTPCEMEESGNVNDNLIIVVPKGSKGAYEQAAGWMRFKITE